MSDLSFSILAFSANFCQIKANLSDNTVWPQALGYQKFVKMHLLGIFNELLYIQNINVARIIRNVEWDFICDFQTLRPIC